MGGVGGGVYMVPSRSSIGGIKDQDKQLPGNGGALALSLAQKSTWQRTKHQNIMGYGRAFSYDEAGYHRRGGTSDGITPQDMTWT